MSVLFGHPTGNPNSHHAALAHFESGRLEAFCVPWMPTPAELNSIGRVPGLAPQARRLERRFFAALVTAPRIEGRLGEWSRLAKRMIGGPWADERLSYQANDWLMRTMGRACRRFSVTAVHSYEDCSLWQFQEAKRLGKACIYDLPIGYYPAWEQTQSELARRYAEWLPSGGPSANRYLRPDQKRREMELADLVLVPGSFVRKTVRQFSDKKVVLAPYGVDLAFWSPAENGRLAEGPLKFIYAGQCSLRKGIPILFQAWRLAGLKDAEIELVGSWQFADGKRRELPPGVRFVGPVSAKELRARYQASDVFVFPSFFEGFGLVLLEAMACGLPVIATEATAGVDVLSEETGRLVTAGDVEALVESLRWFGNHREHLPAMRRAARTAAERCTWERYRYCVSQAVAPFA